MLSKTISLIRFRQNCVSLLSVKFCSSNYLKFQPFFSSFINFSSLSMNELNKKRKSELDSDENEIKACKIDQLDNKIKTITSEIVEKESITENDSKNNEIVEQIKFRPRKFAILLSYSGVGYYGLQRNNPFKTIEEEILKVWHDLKLILPEHYKRPQMLYFQRAARTDKGVSAVRQILTCKLPEEFPNKIDEINSLLPENIRIMGVKRTTKYFDSRTYCDGRTYSYMLPTFALAQPNERVSTYYRVKQELIDEFNSVLQMYKGTHNFHNFTSGKKATDPSSIRFMIELECGKPFLMDEMEFAVVRIRGQSFMLHQIRKMMGLAFAVMRGNATRETIERAFESEKIDIPIAPGLGLLLEEVHYDRYNARYGGDGNHEEILWPEMNAKVDEFKREKIWPNVYEGEKKSFSMLKWLQLLPIHTFSGRDQHKVSEEHQKLLDQVTEDTEKLIENFNKKDDSSLEELTTNESKDENNYKNAYFKANPSSKMIAKEKSETQKNEELVLEDNNAL